MFLNLACIICQSIFLGNIVKYNVSYKCSDEITNEVTRLENLNTIYSIIGTAIDLGISILYALFRALAYLKNFNKKEFEKEIEDIDIQSTNKKRNNPKYIKLEICNKFEISNLPINKPDMNVMQRLNKKSSNNNMNIIDKPITLEFYSTKL